MMEKKRRFMLTDLDGTLLRSDAALSEYTSSVIRQALEEGVIISYATARSYMSSQRVVGTIPWKYPIALYNGAMLFDPVTDEVIGGAWLTRDAANDIIDTGRERGLVPLLFALDAHDRERVLHEPLVREGDIAFRESRPGDPRFAEAEAGRLSCPERWRTLMLTYIGRLEELRPLKTLVEERFADAGLHIELIKDSYIADHYFLEFSHREANKGAALRKWAELVGCEPKEVTVFGDNLNDIGMFREAGERVAVAGAHPALLELATRVAAGNDDDGVAAFVASVLARAKTQEA